MKTRNIRRPLFFIVLLTLTFCEVPAMSDAPPTPAAATAAVSGDNDYDPQVQMVRSPMHSPGYHTKIPEGTMVHTTMASMQYALALLATPDPARHERAAAIIRRVLPLQDTDPQSPNYGTWPWVLEEPVNQMAEADQNWAAFIGSTLVTALIDDSTELPPDLRQAMQTSLRHACRAIIRRDVTLGYTNIAALSCAVTCAAGEALPDPATLAWGRAKLRAFLDYTHVNGGFSEYNSPNYTLTALHELERILHLVKDTQARQDAEALRRLAWRTIADHFHPGTGQWAGPHSRSYSDLLNPGAAQYLADATGVAVGSVQPHPAARRLQSPAWFLPCPAGLAARFRALPSDPLVVESTFSQGRDEQTTRRGTTWFTADACLGSVNRDSLWTQRRPLIAYWSVGDKAGDRPAVLRLRCLKDGRDFASAAVINAQAGPRVASAVRLVSGFGDWHVSLDRPKDHTFMAGDLVVRYELTAPGATSRALSPGVFELAAGGWRALIHVAPESAGEDGRPMRWALGSAPGQVWLDGVYRRGDKAALDLTTTRPPMAGVGLELLHGDAPAAAATPVLERDGRTQWSVGGGLTTAAP